MRRKIAYQALSEIYFEDKHAHLVLKALSLDPQDQAFVSALVYTTLQHDYYLSYQFAPYIDHKLPKEVVLILKMASAQYYKMDAIPPYALVNEYVECAKAVGQHRYSGVVNAVLKKMITTPLRVIEGTPLEVASIEYSMPLWIMKLLSKQYSETFAIEYAKYCSEIKPNYLRINAMKPVPFDDKTMDHFQNKLIAQAALFQSDLLEKGHVIIQDINSQKVVEILDVKPEMTVLDVCCGPGTKTQYIGEFLENTGSLTGIELVDIRKEKTEQFLDNTGIKYDAILQADASTVTLEAMYDRILIDAPCSGLGVLSHKHDLRYHIHPTDLDALESLQQAILRNIMQYLKVGGVAVYATCTLNRKENEKQVEAFVEAFPAYYVIESITTSPMETHGDGFYMAKLGRKEG